MQDKEKMLREEKIGKLLFKLSLPATIGMMFNALYNVVDTIFVGRGVDALAIGGLTIAFPIQMAIMAVAMMIGIGSATNISIAFGAGKTEEASAYAANAYTLITIISAVITTLGLLFIVPLLTLFGASKTLLPYARDYMSIIFIGTIVFSITMVNNNILRAEGRAKVSMIVMLLGTVFNIILDPIFIFGFKMGIKGAAIATVISQFISFSFVIVNSIRGKSIIKITTSRLKLKVKYVKDIVRLGLPAFIRNIVGSLFAIFLNNSIVSFGGDIALSAFGVINRVMMFLFLPMFGMLQGFRPIVGFNYGSGQIGRIKETIRIGIRYLVIYCSVALAVILTLNLPIIKMFTSDKAVLDLGAHAIKIMFLGIPVVGIQIISAAFFQSIGKARPALILSLLRQVIVLLPLILLMPRLFNLGLNGIWVAFPMADILSTFISAFILAKGVKSLKENKAQEAIQPN